ncbi:MAG TPA: DUF3040 domain-containing protein [Myxococcaceae bacterium]|jgi:fatty acid desaturase
MTAALSAYRIEFAKKESDPELKHRLQEAAQDGEERRRQGRIIMRLVAVTYLALLVLALGLAVWGTVEQQKWALGALTTMLGSILGYLVGRKS